MAAVLVQLLIPLVALVRAPAQFGFQMYSGAGWTRITVVDETGARREHRLADYVALDRIDVDWTRRLPEHICDVDAGAVEVTVERSRSTRTVQCQ
ncbi:hypothetical protein [Nocardioides sp. zg-1230]|uniref:hypothetical protein n=1 Tax=Nocardioides sp. zg-1230 TaxID=2736601 RepID=UPI001553D846|nr:hypothetical protein [Nocardioides sp. zg-1230]NPC43526.1 hypothetical protein [Nocardioides sp. zg-1230]